MIKLDLQINNQSRFSIDSERLFDGILEKLNLEFGPNNEESIMVSLLVVGKEQMAEFNWQYHQTQGPTDVLSFPYTDPESLPKEAEGFVLPPDAGIILGDIIVCYEVAEEIAKKEDKPVGDVIEFYVLHGLEHLLGHHHE